MDRSSAASLWLASGLPAALKLMSALVLMFFRLPRTLAFKMFFFFKSQSIYQTTGSSPFPHCLAHSEHSRSASARPIVTTHPRTFVTSLSSPWDSNELMCVRRWDSSLRKKKGFIAVTFCNTTHLSSHQATLGWWIKEPTLMQVLVLLLLLSTQLWKARTACQARSLWRLAAKCIRCFRVHSAADCPLTQNN